MMFVPPGADHGMSRTPSCQANRGGDIRLFAQRDGGLCHPPVSVVATAGGALESRLQVNRNFLVRLINEKLQRK